MCWVRSKKSKICAGEAEGLFCIARSVGWWGVGGALMLGKLYGMVGVGASLRAEVLSGFVWRILRAFSEKNLYAKIGTT